MDWYLGANGLYSLVNPFACFWSYGPCSYQNAALLVGYEAQAPVDILAVCGGAR
jgi:hypothetical protein